MTILSERSEGRNHVGPAAFRRPGATRRIDGARDMFLRQACSSIRRPKSESTNGSRMLSSSYVRRMLLLIGGYSVIVSSSFHSSRFHSLRISDIEHIRSFLTSLENADRRNHLVRRLAVSCPNGPQLDRSSGGINPGDAIDRTASCPSEFAGTDDELAR